MSLGQSSRSFKLHSGLDVLVRLKTDGTLSARLDSPPKWADRDILVAVVYADVRRRET